jgi:tetratricopeptide (TPR) repeat protein
VYGNDSVQCALAWAGLGEVKKIAGDMDGAIADMERALALNLLSDLDASRVLTHLGSAYSEVHAEKASPKTLECFERAVRLRGQCFVNGNKHFLVAEIQLDIAAEHWEAKRFVEALAALEAAVPYLSLPEKAMEIQWSWLRKCYEQAGLTVEEASERYRNMKTLRKQVERQRRRLPARKEDKDNSFLSAATTEKKKAGGAKKSSKKKK